MKVVRVVLCCVAIATVSLSTTLAIGQKVAAIHLTPNHAFDSSLVLESGETGTWSLHANTTSGQEAWTIKQSSYSANPDVSVWTTIANAGGTTPHQYRATVGPTTPEENLAATVDGELQKPPGTGGGSGVAMPEELPFTANLAAEGLTILRDEDDDLELFKTLTSPQSVSGKKLRDALPGQLINLTYACTPPAGQLITGRTWEIDGAIFKDWLATNDSGHLDKFDEDDEAFHEAKIHFYWTNPGFHNVKLTISLNFDEIILTKTEQFNVAPPNVLMARDDDLGKVAVGEVTLMGTDRDALGLFPVGGARVGFPTIGGEPAYSEYPNDSFGIVFTGAVGMPPGWTSATGTWNFVQLVTSDRYYVKNGVNKKVDMNGVEVLDTIYPAKPNIPDDGITYFDTGFGEEADNQEDGDSPAILPGTTVTQVTILNERYRTWIMFRPPGIHSRYVPMHMVSWRWGGKMVKTGTAWAMDEEGEDAYPSHQYRASAVATTEHPEWGDNIKNAVEANDNVAGITVAIDPLTIEEGAGVIAGEAMVSVPENVTQATGLTIYLSSSDITRLTVPTSITIPQGSNSASFSFNVLNNFIGEMDMTVIVFGQSSGFRTGSDSIVIQDND